MTDLSKVQEKIAELLTQEKIDIDDLVRRTGLPLGTIFPPAATAKEKIKRSYDRLRKLGNARWLITQVLIHAAESDVRREITDAFPEMWSQLPLTETEINAAAEYLQAVLSIPFSRD